MHAPRCYEGSYKQSNADTRETERFHGGAKVDEWTVVRLGRSNTCTRKCWRLAFVVVIFGFESVALVFQVSRENYDDPPFFFCFDKSEIIFRLHSMVRTDITFIVHSIGTERHNNVALEHVAL